MRSDFSLRNKKAYEGAPMADSFRKAICTDLRVLLEANDLAVPPVNSRSFQLWIN